MTKPVFAIVGPTASGKSQIGMIVAQKLNCEIISADSRQIYKYLDIGTAKPTIEDRTKVVHHFIDELLPDQNFSAGDFQKQARRRIQTIIERGKRALIVGGSGLYIEAAVDGFFEGPSANPEIRGELERRLRKEGSQALLDELRTIDPVLAEKMLPSNTRRIIRALEVYKVTGIPLSVHHKNEKKLPPFRTEIIGLMWDRKKLYSRINQRVDWMINNGLLNEVNKLIEMGYSLRNNSLQTVGYKEVFQFLEGVINFDNMVNLIKQNSRRYAKRQLTWFKKDERIKWFEMKDEAELEKAADAIIEHFKNTVVFSR